MKDDPKNPKPPTLYQGFKPPCPYGSNGSCWPCDLRPGGLGKGGKMFVFDSAGYVK